MAKEFMNNREVKVTQEGQNVFMFIAELLNNKEFDINGPITDTYLHEVGWFVGLSIEKRNRVIKFLLSNNLLE